MEKHKGKKLHALKGKKKDGSPTEEGVIAKVEEGIIVPKKVEEAVEKEKE